MAKMEEEIAETVGECNKRKEDIYREILIPRFKDRASENTVYKYVRDMVKEGKLREEYKQIEHGTCKLLFLVNTEDKDVSGQNADAGKDEIPHIPCRDEENTDRNGYASENGKKPDEFAVRPPSPPPFDIEAVEQGAEGFIQKIILANKGLDMMIELIGMFNRKL